jgi:hypothetical protein
LHADVLVCRRDWVHACLLACAVVRIRITCLRAGVQVCLHTNVLASLRPCVRACFRASVLACMRASMQSYLSEGVLACRRVCVQA